MPDPTAAPGPGPNAFDPSTAAPGIVMQGATISLGALVQAAATDPAAPAAPNPIVDFDAGGSWGAETITLKHPFKLKGVVYQTISMRLPTGLDLTRFYADKNRGLVQVAIGLCSANGAPIDDVVFGAMFAEDAQVFISKTSDFLFGPQATSTTS